MLGIILALLLCAWHNVVGGVSDFGELYLAATNFLYWWYLLCGILVVLIGTIFGLLTFLGLSISGAVVGAEAGPTGMIIGGLGGITAGGIAGFLVFLSVIAKRAALVVGIWLMHAAYLGPDNWDLAKLIIGVVLLVLGLWKNKSSSSSTSSSSSSN